MALVPVSLIKVTKEGMDHVPSNASSVLLSTSEVGVASVHFRTSARGMT